MENEEQKEVHHNQLAAAAFSSQEKVREIKASLTYDMDRIKDANQKLLKVEKEINHTVSIMSNMLVELKNRSKDIATLKEATPTPTSKLKAIHNVIDPLKFIEFKPEFYEHTKEAFENDFKESEEKYETLYDFVNIKSLDELSAKAKESYIAFEKSMDALNYNINFLIGSSESIFESIFKANQLVDSEYKDIEKYKSELLDIDAVVAIMYNEIVKVGKESEAQVEKLKRLEKITTLEQRAEEISMGLSEQVKEYFRLLSVKRKNYSLMITESHQIKENVRNLDGYVEKFEATHKKLQDVYAQCDTLSDCYSKFQESYNLFLTEINRRKKYEEMIENEVSKWRVRFEGKYNKEYQVRSDFKEKCQKNLPSLLQPIVKEKPIKYEIFPTTPWTITAKLSYN